MKFVVKRYTIKTDKFISADKISAVFLSDLHLTMYGQDNERLLSKIDELSPDLVLSGGDMIVGDNGYSTEIAQELLCNLAKKYSVYVALGNHEKRFKEKTERFGDAYARYAKQLASSGVHILDNENKIISVNGESIRLYGLSLPLLYYHRFSKHSLSVEELQMQLGKANMERFNLLLAHHPRFADTYFDWGADLTLSGHIHGGVMRLGKKALISPDFTLFPKYGYGCVSRDKKYLLISAGLGEHTVPFRLFNPKELLYIEIIQEVSHGDSR